MVVARLPILSNITAELIIIIINFNQNTDYWAICLSANVACAPVFRNGRHTSLLILVMQLQLSLF